MLVKRPLSPALYLPLVKSSVERSPVPVLETHSTLLVLCGAVWLFLLCTHHRHWLSGAARGTSMCCQLPETHLLLQQSTAFAQSVLQPSHKRGRGEAEPQPGPIPPALAQRLLAPACCAPAQGCRVHIAPVALWPLCQRQAWWGNELRLGRASFLVNKDSQQPTLGEVINPRILTVVFF